MSNITVPTAVTPATYILTLYAYNNIESAYMSNITSITVIAPTIPTIGDITPSPDPVFNDNIQLLSFTTTITDKGGGIGSVYIDLSSINNSSTRTLFNVGGNTYKVSNITVPPAVTPATYTLTLYVYNSIESSYMSNITSITVVTTPVPAIGDITLTPDPVLNDDTQLLSFTTTITDKGGGVGSVYMDLSSINNSSTRALFNVGGNTYKVSNITVPFAVTPATYTLTLYAYNNIDTVFMSNITSVSVSGVLPAAPAILSIYPSAMGQIGLIWENVAFETSYTLFRSTNNMTNSATNIFWSPTDLTNHSDTGLSNSTTYYYWVKAYNVNGASPYSAIDSSKTLSKFPSAPAIDITVVSTSQIDIVWEHIVNASTYTLFRNTVNDTSSAINIFDSTNNNVTNHSDTGLDHETIYYYWVKAYNINGESPYSDVTFVRTTSIYPTIYAVFPTIFNTEEVNTVRINFGGEQPDADITIYDVAGNIVWTRSVSGELSVLWDGKNDAGTELETGMYIVFIKLKDGTEYRIKMVINRKLYD